MPLEITDAIVIILDYYRRSKTSNKPNLEEVPMKEILAKTMDETTMDKAKEIISSAFGCIPYVGPAIQEIIGFVIPNQRLDRVANFVKQLDTELQEFGKSQKEIKELLSRPEYSSLFYKTCVGCADSYSKERIRYFKNIFIYGLKDDTNLQKARAEAFLNLLMKLTDLEIGLLKYYELVHSATFGDQAPYYYLKSLGLETGLPSKDIDIPEDAANKGRIKELSLRNLVSYGLLFENELIDGSLSHEHPLDETRCFLSPIGELFISTIKTRNDN